MPTLEIAKPAEIGFDPIRLRIAFDLLRKWAAADQVPAAGVCVGRHGKALEPIFAGQAKSDSLFLVASLSKPVTVAAAMVLVERGLIALDDRVSMFVPKFAANGKKDVRLRHLMTHTSGLPDMPPDNLMLRKEQKPLAAFIESTCRLPLLFEPGAKVNYQSMGAAMLGEIVHQVGGSALPEFLAQEIFTPLGMSDTSLGWNPASKERIVPVRLPKNATAHEIVWNTPYWLGLGSPWGGLITTPTDYAALLLGDAWQRPARRHQDSQLDDRASDDIQSVGCDAQNSGGGATLPAVGPWLALELAGAFGEFWRFARSEKLRALGRDRHTGLVRSGRRRLRGAAHDATAGTGRPFSGPAQQCDRRRDDLIFVESISLPAFGFRRGGILPL